MDFKYILKRVLIGVAIGVILMLIKGNLLISASAKEISSYSWGYLSYPSNNISQTSSIQVSITGNPWANWRYGYLYFTFNTYSYSQYLPTVRSVVASSDTANYVCHIGTVSSTSDVDSTNQYTSVTYSAYCPMDLGTPGLTLVTFNFVPNATAINYDFALNLSSQATYEESDGNIVLNQSDTTNAINSQTTTITNNQNQNTQQQIDSQMVCTIYDISSTTGFGYLEATDGSVHSTQNSKVTDFIPLTSSNKLTLLDNATQNNNAICFYNVNKSYISCLTRTQYGSLTDITIPNNTNYVRFTINVEQNKPQWKICKNGNQAIAEQQEQINNSLNNSDIDNTTGNDFFDNFNYGDDSLSAVITAPLRFFNRLTDSCSPLSLSLYNQTITLPCGSIVWARSDFSSFVSWWNLFFGGIAIYTLGLKLFKVVHDAIDPQKDNIESVGV